MAKYKIGDKIIIRRDLRKLVGHISARHIGVNSDMTNIEGKNMTISSVRKEGKYYLYLLEGVKWTRCEIYLKKGNEFKFIS